MDMTQPVMPLQLRVLAGLHEGAVVALADQGLALATGGDADVLLRDAPAQASLALVDGVWTWRETGFEQALQSGQAWRWGAVVLALAAADQPWPDALPPLVFDRQSFEAPVLPDEAPAPEASAKGDDAHPAAAGAEAAPPLLADAAEPDGLEADFDPKLWRLQPHTLSSGPVHSLSLTTASPSWISNCRMPLRNFSIAGSL